MCDVDRAHRQVARRLVEDTYATQAGAALYRGCAEYNNLEEILVRSDIDAVVVATPNHWHALATVLAAQAGKHIYCEKPAATSIPEGRAMVEAVRRAGVVCQIGSQQRSWPSYQHGIDLIRNGYLGTISRVRVHMPGGYNTTHSTPVPTGPETIPDGFDYDRWLGPIAELPYRAARCHYNWRFSFETSGGDMEDWVGHNYDSMTVALGLTATQPVAIRKASATFITNHPIYNTAASLEFEAVYPNGTVVECSNRFREIRIEGTEGWVEMSRGGNTYSSKALQQVVIPPNRQILGAGNKLPAHYEHMENFLTCVRSGARPRCPIDEAHNSAAVCHLANAAFRSGCKEFAWDPFSETVIDAPAVGRLLTRTFRSPWTLPT
ncbi:MAG: Gfo/Idh/MocA family oxidoreductase [Verrucomicrobia bacterium]|nr:Gfo/Idh/MocA family oxidoreductase [Verrucomicrobiota bacterium]